MATLQRTSSPSSDALEELLDRVRPRIKRILGRYRVPPQDVEDLVQEALLSTVRRWSRLREPEGWLVGAVRHQCLMYWRGRRRRLYDSVDDLLLELLAEPVASPAERVDRARDLERLMPRISPRCRALLELRYSLGLGPTEIAAKMGYRKGSMTNLTQRCVAALTRVLVAAGYREEVDHAQSA